MKNYGANFLQFGFKFTEYFYDYFSAFTWRRAFYVSLLFHILFLFGLTLSGVFKRNPFDKIINLNLLPPMQVVSVGSPESAVEKKPTERVLPQQEAKKDDIYEVKTKKKQPPILKKETKPEPKKEDLRKKLEKKLAAIEKESAANNPSLNQAAAFGAAEGGVSTSQYFPYNWYLRGLQTKITNAWQEPSSFARLENRRAIVSFTLARDGSVSNVTLKGSSGMEQLDQSALEAVQAAQPFSPLPDDYKQPTLDVAIQFEVTP